MHELDLTIASEGSPYRGRYFVRLKPYQKLVRLELRLMGATYKGVSHMLPERVAPGSIRRLRIAAERDAVANQAGMSDEYRLRCEELEIACLKLRGEGRGESVRAAALGAARQRLASMSPAERDLMRRIVTERVTEADRCRTIVLADTVRVGDSIIEGSSSHKVTGLGSAWTVGEEELLRLRRRFPEAEEIQAGSVVQYAIWPEVEETPDLSPAPA